MYNPALVLKEKGFDVLCNKYAFWQSEFDSLPTVITEINKNSIISTSSVSLPSHQEVIDWFRDVKNIDITIMPVFREKCSYDSFKRDGYTFTILRIEPCQFLTWSDFNQCAEDRDNDKEDNVLTPSFKDYYDALNTAIEQAILML